MISSPPLALLIFPPIYDFALYDLFLKPYSLLRLGSWLAKSGFRIRLVNSLDYRDRLSRERLGKPRREPNGTGKLFRQVVPKPQALRSVPRNFARYGILPESLEARLRGQPPDLVLVSSGMTYWYPGVSEAVRTVRRLFPKAPIVLGGIYATLCPEHARRHSEADFVVSGEALPRLEQILQDLGLPHSDELLEEDPILLPEALPECGVIRLNRGCPLRCRYCASYILHGGFQAGDPDLGFQIVQKMNKKFGTTSFAFYDDALLAAGETVIIPFLERVIDSNLKLFFYLPNGVHLCFLDARTARLMKRAGFREVRLGFESVRPEFHQELDRKLLPPMLADGVELLSSVGFRGEEISVYVLAGLPGQSAGEIEQSIRYAASLGVRVRLAEYSPVPGSPLWEESVRSSLFPLAEEPLTHNNSILPLRWSGLTLQDLEGLKSLARSLSAPKG